MEAGTLLDPFGLTFRSSDARIFRLEFEVLPIAEDWGNLAVAYMEIYSKVLFEACKAIRTHPLVSHVKHLQVKYRDVIWGDIQEGFMADEVEGLLNSVGSLEMLTLDGCDPWVFFTSFLDSGDPLRRKAESSRLPPIKELIISHPLIESGEERCMEAIVELAKSQYSRGLPYERVTVRAKTLPEGMEERLNRWVGRANCHVEEPAKKGWRD